MRRELDHAGVGQNYVVIQPTARQIFKCWDNAKFSAVIDALHARGYEVVLTSGPDKDDLACVNEIAQWMPDATSNGAGRKGDLPGTWCVNRSCAAVYWR